VGWSLGVFRCTKYSKLLKIYGEQIFVCDLLFCPNSLLTMCSHEEETKREREEICSKHEEELASLR
jgi:hypothetical protein